MKKPRELIEPALVLAIGIQLLDASASLRRFARDSRRHRQDAVYGKLSGLGTERCQFANLPETHRGRWGEGLTAEEMAECRWLKPRLIATIEYLELTAANHLRHAKFVSLLERS